MVSPNRLSVLFLCISMMTMVGSGIKVPIASRRVASFALDRPGKAALLDNDQAVFISCETYFRKYKTSLILLLAWSTNAGAQDNLWL